MAPPSRPLGCCWVSVAILLIAVPRFPPYASQSPPETVKLLASSVASPDPTISNSARCCRVPAWSCSISVRGATGASPTSQAGGLIALHFIGIAISFPQLVFLLSLKSIRRFFLALEVTRVMTCLRPCVVRRKGEGKKKRKKKKRH